MAKLQVKRGITAKVLRLYLQDSNGNPLVGVAAGAGALATPTGLALTPSGTGGTLGAGTFAYRVSALGPYNAETLACAEVTTTFGSGTTNEVALSWGAVTGASGYKVYGRTSGAELLLATLGGGSTSWTDTGAATPSGALPAQNTTGFAVYYHREGDAAGATYVSLVAGTVGTWSSGGWAAVDANGLPGVYELGIPNTGLSSGQSIVLSARGAPGQVPLVAELQLDSADLQDATALGLANLNATISSRATPAQLLATPANLLVTDSAGAVTTGTIASAALTALAGAVWNALTSALTTAGSIGILLKGFVFTGANVNANVQVLPSPAPAGYGGASLVTQSGTAQAGSSASVTLAAAAAAVDSFYLGQVVTLTSGTGAGQAGVISGYVGATRVATVSHAWATPPDSTSQYSVLSLPTPALDAAGEVNLNMGEATPRTPVMGTVGDDLLATEAQGVGKWVQSGTTLTIYDHAGTTVVRVFTLDSATAPTQRV